MLFGGLTPKKERKKMPLNTCKIIIKNDNQAITSKGNLCTNDVELHVHHAHLSTLTVNGERFKMKKIIANQEACMGCGLCEVYCTTAHSKSKDIIKAYNSEQPQTHQPESDAK